MDTMNDHIRLVNFGFGGKPESIFTHLRYSITRVLSYSYLSASLYVFSFSLLLELYTFKAFTDQMNPRKELRRQLENCIEPSVDNWFSMLKARVMPSGGVRNTYYYCSLTVNSELMSFDYLLIV